MVIAKVLGVSVRTPHRGGAYSLVVSCQSLLKGMIPPPVQGALQHGPHGALLARPARPPRGARRRPPPGRGHRLRLGRLPLQGRGPGLRRRQVYGGVVRGGALLAVL